MTTPVKAEGRFVAHESLPLDLRQWETSAPEAWEDYRERCALVEFLGKVPRARAEEQSERIVRERWSRGGDEAMIASLHRHCP